MRKIVLPVLVLFLIFIFGCTSDSPTTTTTLGNNQLANPASVFCEQHGGTLRIVDNENGQQGICTLKDGKQCDEWAYFRGECPVCTGCPQISPPAPDFCKEGVIVPREPDSCGCIGPPWCRY